MRRLLFLGVRPSGEFLPFLLSGCANWPKRRCWISLYDSSSCFLTTLMYFVWFWYRILWICPSLYDRLLGILDSIYFITISLGSGASSFMYAGRVYSCSPPSKAPPAPFWSAPGASLNVLYGITRLYSRCFSTWPSTRFQSCDPAFASLNVCGPARVCWTQSQGLRWHFSGVSSRGSPGRPLCLSFLVPREMQVLRS